MGLKEVRDAAVKAAEELKAGHLVAGGRQLVIVINGGLDIAEDLGFQGVGPRPANEGPDQTLTLEQAKSALKECNACCKQVCDTASEGPAPVGKLGDGVLLGKLIEAAMKALELWLKIPV